MSEPRGWQRRNLRRWRDELRTTDLAQGKGLLKTTLYDGTIRYCCLGIWCELREQDGAVESKENEYHTFSFRKVDPAGRAEYANSLLPPGVSEELGSPPGSGNVLVLSVSGMNDRDGSPLKVTGTAANDDHNLTFPQIADCLTWTYNLDDPELDAE